MRIVKEAEERKNEILDAANALFEQKGFDGTSTADILEKVGIARGTLYYHFKSKEDIMDALLLRATSRIISAAQGIASRKEIPVVARMMDVVQSLNISEEDSGTKQQIEHMHSPQNALMHQKTQKLMISGVTPILAGIVREGVEQGLFDTPFPYECMEMVMTYAGIVFDGDDTVELTAESRASRVEAFVCNVERLLGAQSGSVGTAMMRVLDGEN